MIEHLFRFGIIRRKLQCALQLDLCLSQILLFQVNSRQRGAINGRVAPCESLLQFLRGFIQFSLAAQRFGKPASRDVSVQRWSRRSAAGVAASWDRRSLACDSAQRFASHLPTLLLPKRLPSAMRTELPMDTGIAAMPYG